MICEIVIQIDGFNFRTSHLVDSIPQRVSQVRKFVETTSEKNL